jgi:hypothetical protein
MDREPEAWQTDAAGPFITIGELSVWAIGDHLFRIESPAGIEQVARFQKARLRARERAGL